ncbi:L,D-transpeptidase family protein [Pinibacter aurantiacus]|uniref:L,D-transpeptidase family protein n=1 Tax=Pinibacter aurantiacus TaxID=2851599 RepID=A0A9E2S4V7_9BACT|nr:L,D-transpeptidase family protein [Pinibacter aurantiacus]MBV4355751.1 L,D-transpeptidase family protein [Pinibacter aurantiacus]
MKKILLIFCFISSVIIGQSQTSQNNFQPTFINYQRSFPKINDIIKRKEDTLAKQFAEKGLVWPASYIYIRSFKYDSQMEVWVKNDKKEQYKLFKTYKICAMAGTLGPKRIQGDYQVPEGFYYINEFNPKSLYHLSLGLNYPNPSDQLLSDSAQPGGDIYIHGSCVTTGCIPITDGQVEELYVLAANAKNRGQDFIPVHIFPIQFKNKRSADYLENYLRSFPSYYPLANTLKSVYYYFDKYHEVPLIMVDSKGDYVIDDEVKKASIVTAPVKIEKKKYEKKIRPEVHFDEKEIPTSVNKLPVYPGGNEAFQTFLQKTGKDAAAFLPEEQHTAYVQVEFIVDKTGKIINPRVVKGGNDEANDVILDAFEKMPLWTPAIRLEQNVPMKLKQTVVVGK